MKKKIKMRQSREKKKMSGGCSRDPLVSSHSPQRLRFSKPV
jgi:hypothetical protein